MQSPDSLTPAQRYEVLINRTNVALARSQRLIESWLPAKSANSSSAEDKSETNDDEDGMFKSMSETAGVGSAKAFAEDEDGGLRKKSGLTKGNERLLETILGRKGAREKVRSAEKGSGHEAVKKLEGEGEGRGPERKVEQEDDEDEEDRLARFGGRKRRRVEDEGEGEDDERSEAEPQRTAREARMKRRKPASYLDELLAGKKSKMNKQKLANDAH